MPLKIIVMNDALKLSLSKSIFNLVINLVQ